MFVCRGWKLWKILPRFTVNGVVIYFLSSCLSFTKRIFSERKLCIWKGVEFEEFFLLCFFSHSAWFSLSLTLSTIYDLYFRLNIYSYFLFGSDVVVPLHKKCFPQWKVSEFFGRLQYEFFQGCSDCECLWTSSTTRNLIHYDHTEVDHIE